MAIRAKLVSFTSQMALGPQAVSGVGFHGTLAYLFSTTRPNEPCNLWMGMDDSTTHICRSFSDKDLGAGPNSEVAWSLSYSLVDNRAIAINQIGQVGYISAFTADGFTVQWDSVGLAPQPVTWIALVLGGDIGGLVSYSQWGASGAFTKTGVPFRPVGLLGWINGGVPAFGFPTRSSGGSNLDTGISWAADPSCGVTNSLVLKGGKGNPSQAASRQEAGKFWVDMAGSSGTITGFTADGWTGTNDVGGVGVYHAYMALHQCACNSGTFLQPAVAGIQRIPILAAQPVAILVVSTDKVSALGNTNDLLFSMGAATATEQMAVWTGDKFGTTSPVFVDHFTDLGAFGISRYPTGSFASTPTARFTNAGFGNGFFDINWTLVDGTAREWMYFVIAEDVGTGPCGAAAPPQCVPIAPDVPGSATSPTEFGSGSVSGGSGVIV